MSDIPDTTPSRDDPENDPRSIEELIAAALIEQDLDERDEDGFIIAKSRRVLCRRCNRDVLEAGKALLKSASPKERQLGADILGNLGTYINQIPDSDDQIERMGEYVYPFATESADALLETLQTEEDPYVLWLIGLGLGRLGDERRVEPLVRLKNHPHSYVRYGVVMGLCGSEDERAIQTLIELMQDEAIEVRDWATFNIGTILVELDTPEIRAALHRNIDDPDEETRYEALTGLAYRRDLDIVPRILDELTSGEVHIDSSVGSDFVEMLYALRHKIDDPRLPPIIEGAMKIYPDLTKLDEE